MYHRDHVGFLFTVSPPERAQDVARALNEALALADGSLNAAALALAVPVKNGERWMVVAITSDGDDLVLRYSANLSEFVDGRHGADSGLEVPAGMGPGLYALRDCTVYGTPDEEEREPTTIEGTWVKLHDLSATGATRSDTPIHQPSYDAGYAQGALDTAQQADPQRCTVSSEEVGCWTILGPAEVVQPDGKVLDVPTGYKKTLYGSTTPSAPFSGRQG